MILFLKVICVWKFLRKDIKYAVLVCELLCNIFVILFLISLLFRIILKYICSIFSISLLFKIILKCICYIFLISLLFRIIFTLNKQRIYGQCFISVTASGSNMVGDVSLFPSALKLSSASAKLQRGKCGCGCQKKIYINQEK